MNNEERDSQLSAMFDDELPTGECELLARRLARDPVLQARWGRYAAIGACLKGQEGVRLPGHNSVADHVRIALGGEVIHGQPVPEQAKAGGGSLIPRWLMPLGMAGSAAAVAAVAIVWMRTQAPVVAVAQSSAPAPGRGAAPPVQMQTMPVAPVLSPQISVTAPQVLQVDVAMQGAGSAPGLKSRERDSYVVPAPSLNQPMVLLPARDANYQGSPAQYPGPVH